MNTIDTLPGDRIEKTARQLVASAPAFAEFNGIRIRARYATTNPRDIVAQYWRETEMRSIVWRHSREGKRVAAEQEAGRVELQARADEGMRALPSIDFDNCDAVLRWVEDMANAVDRVGVAVDRAVILRAFAAHGWEPGVNCGDDFNGDDARNFAGWIVGQWLSCWAPLVVMFARQWRETFEKL